MKNFASIMALMNAIDVTRRVGAIISVGFLSPMPIKIAITVAGIN